jgi:hypothetical protein
MVAVWLGGMNSSSAPHASPAAIFRGRLRLRLDAFKRIGMSLDPDHRKDDDRRGLADLAAEAHNAPVVRKSDYGAHHPLPLPPARA